MESIKTKFYLFLYYTFYVCRWTIIKYIIQKGITQDFHTFIITKHNNDEDFFSKYYRLYIFNSKTIHNFIDINFLILNFPNSLVSRDDFDEIIAKNHNLINYKNIKDFIRHIPLKYLEMHINEIDFNYLCYYKELPINFMIKYSNLLNWKFVSQKQFINKSFIRRFYNKLNFSYLIYRHLLDIDDIRKYKNYIDTKDIKTILQSYLNCISIDKFKKLKLKYDYIKFIKYLEYIQHPCLWNVK